MTFVNSKELLPADLATAIGDDPSVLLGRTPGIDTIIHRVFTPSGADRDTFDAQAAAIEQRLLAGTSALGVSFRLLDPAVLGDHGGAYSATAPGGPTIFLRSDILSASSQVVRSVVFEEIGHHLDTLLNDGLDSRGDEGEYFSDLVRGVSLSTNELSRLQREDDHGVLTSNGQSVSVEFNTIGGVARSVRYDEGSEAIPLQPNLTLHRNSGRGESAPDTITSVTLTIPAVSSADRIRVPEATVDAAATIPSPLAEGVTVPAAAVAKSDFWVRSENGKSIRFNVSTTPTGSFTFTAPGSSGAASFAAFQDLIQSLRYDNTADAPDTSGRRFAWSITSVVTATGAPLPIRNVVGTVTITPVNHAPSIDEKAPPSDIFEAGASGDGVPSSLVSLSKSDIDSTAVRYDTSWLQANGWTTEDGGLTYSAKGRYGLATLTIATDRVAYAIDDTLPAVDSLDEGEVAEDTFTVRVIDTGVANRRSAGKPQTATKDLVFRVIGKADFQTFGDTVASISYTEKDAPAFLQPTISLHRNTGSGSNAPETITSVRLTIAEASITDRIRVQGAQGDAAGATESKLVIGLSVPTASTAATDFWVPNTIGGTDKFTVAVTPTGAFTFTTAAIGQSSFSAFEDLLRRVQYDSTSSTPDAEAREFTWTISRVASGSGVALPSRKFEQSVSILPVNDAPTVEVGVASNDLTEGTSSAAGTDTATVLLAKSDADSPTVTYDDAWLVSNGWVSVAGGTLYTHAGTYGTASLDVSSDTVSYLLDNTLPATDALSAGETVDDPFSVRVIDDLGATTDATLAFTIRGATDNPITPPTVTAGQASNALVELGTLVAGVSTATATFTLSSVDSTVTIDTTWLELNGWTTADAGVTYTIPGTYGTATLDVATATITYLLDDTLPATDALADGQLVSELFTIQVIDAAGLTAQATATFDITGSADGSAAPPTVTAGQASNALVELGTLVAGVSTATATFTLSSVDSTVTIDTTWLELNGWTTADAGVTYTIPGTYGTATLDVATATITYLLDDTLPATDALAQDQVVTETFTIQVIDAAGLTAQATATFDITGSADGSAAPPTVTAGQASNALVELGTLVAGVSTATATFTLSSVDSTVTIDSAWLELNGWSTADAGITYTIPGTYGTATLDVATATITYLLDDTLPATDALADGQLVSELFTIQVLDANGLTAQATATFDITGSADGSAAPPTVTAGQASNALVELGTLVAGVSTATATFTLSSVDSTVAIDTTWLELNGWTTADAGVTYTTPGTYGTATLDVATATITYLLDDTLPATDALADGQLVSELFTIQVIDAAGLTAQATATFDITGSADGSAAPPTVTAGQASNALVELGTLVAGVSTATATFTLSSVDSTVTIDTTWLELNGWTTADAGITYTIPGTYGTATLDVATATITYLLDDTLPATDALADGQLVSETFTIQAIDAAGLTAQATATFDITGSADGSAAPPTVTAGQASNALVETGTLVAGVSTATATFTLSSVDSTVTIDSAWLELNGWTTADAGITYTIPGTYGTANLDVATATITYLLDDTLPATDALADGQLVSELFTIQVIDAAGLTAQASATFDITGSADAPVVTASAASNALVELGTLVAGVSTATATFTLSSVDSTVTIDTTWLELNGWTTADAGITYTTPGTYGTATLDVATATITYLLDDTLPATDALADGQAVSETFTIQAIDAAGLTAQASATFDITGSADAPVVTAGPVSNALVELGTLVAGVNTASATFALSSVDSTVTIDTTWLELNGWTTADAGITYTTPGTYGTATLDVATATITYLLDDTLPATDALADGQAVSETFTIQAIDAAGLTAQASATFDITGSADAPVVTAGPVSNALVELGTLVAGVNTASATFALSSVDSTVTIDTTWLELNGWTTADAGITYTTPGTYGTATLDVATATITYLLDDTLPATDALADGQAVSETFTIQVVAANGLTAQASATFDITGSADAPVVTASAASNALVELGTLLAGVNTATATFTLSSVDSTVTIDSAWLELNGWTTADAGITYTIPGTYGTANLDVATATITYLLDDTLPATDALADGQLVSELFTIQVIDAAGLTAQASATFDITGSADAPVVTASAASNALVELGTLLAGVSTATATFTLSSVDSTVTIDSAWLELNGWTTADAGITYTTPGTYGTATLDVATTTITYLLDDTLPATDALADGLLVSETFTIQVIDAAGLTAQASATFDITGSADAPVVTAGPVSNALVELGALVAGVSTATATFTLSSIDSTVTIDTTWLELNGWTTADAGITYTTPGTYGTATLDVASATITYLLDDTLPATDALADGQAVSEVFTIQVIDAAGLTAQASATFDITGSADAPVVTASAASNGLIELGTLVAGVSTATATFTLSSVDSTVTIDSAWLELNGWTTADAGITYTTPGTYGTATLDVATTTITYLLDDTLPATDALADGQAVSELFTIQAIDAAGLTAQASATFDITGSADAPVVTAGPVSNALVELGTLVAGVNTATATFTLSSVDSTVTIDTTWLELNGWSTADAGITYTTPGTYGTATLDVATATITYLLDDTLPATDALADGQAVSELFTIQAIDAAGLTAQATATFDITGSADAPIVTAGPVSNALVELGTLVAGVSTATATFTLSSVDSTVTIDSAWLELNGWTTADAGITYTTPGTYGTATLDVATATITYLLDDTLPATDALADGQAVSELFTIQAIDAAGLTAQATATFDITGSADAPIVTASAASNGLIELGALVAGVNTASATFALSSVDSTVTIDTTWLELNGWTTADAGITYTTAGTYGTATLDVATATITYLLDDTLAATDALADGQLVSETFTIQVIDAAGLTAQATATFDITGSADAPIVTASAASNGLIELGALVAGVNTATATFALSSIDSTVTIDTTWLELNGWTTADAGITYTTPGTYGTATLDVATATITYLLDDTLPATDALADGQAVSETFTIQVIDAAGLTAQAAATFDITGSADAPVVTASAASNALVELGTLVAGVSTATATFTLSSVDSTVAIDTTWLELNGWTTADAGLTYAIPGTYGTATLDVATATITYLLDDTLPATDALAQDQVVSELFTIQVLDANGLTAQASATFDITGSADAPVVTASAASNALVELGTLVAGVNTASATFTLSSVDSTVTIDSAWLELNGWTTADAGITYTIPGTYGTANLDVATATITYLLDDTLPATDALADGQLVSETFTIQVIDAAGLTAQASATFDITGSADAPTITASAASNALVELGTLVAGVSTATATFTLSSVDSTVTIDSAWLELNGWSTADAGITYTTPGTYGTATLDVATATITYLLDDTLPATDALADGQAVSETFTIQAIDAAGLTAQASATFDITGSADAPVVTAGPVSNALVELGTLVAGVNTASATFALSSVDSTVTIDTTWLELNGWSTADAGITYTIPGTYGTATLDVATATITYLLDDTLPATDALADGQAVSETFTIQVVAANGLTAQASATFDITGSADAPVVTASAASNGLIELGALVAGVNTASATFTLSSVDSTVTIDTTWLELNGWSTADAGITYTTAGTYGTATLDVATATITYLLDDTLPATDALADGQAVSETFTIQVVAANGLTAQATATFDITGSADAPVVTASAASNALVELGTLVAGVSTATVTLAFTSSGGTAAIDIAWLEANGWVTADGGLSYAVAGTYGTATLDIATAAITYFLDDAIAATNALADGQLVSEIFTIQVVDGSGLTTQATTEFSVVGSNDAPSVIANAPSNGLVKAGFFLAGVNAATVALTLADVDGTVTIDVPWLESFGWTTADGGLTYTHGGDYGIATLDVATGVVSYLLDDTLPTTQALVTGQTVFDAFTIQVIDNSGITADATASFSIDGTDTLSTFTANVAGYASVSSANPTAATLGILNPANTLLISIPAEAGAIDILNVQWEWFDINTNAWISIPGANSLTYLPNDFDAVPAGAVIHAVAEYTDATGPMLITSVETAPLGVEMVGTLVNDAFFGTIYQDVLYGGDGNDSLDGNLGADYLAGGFGDDTYVVDELADVVVENPGEGIDSIQSSISWTLGDDVENLTLIGLGTIDGTGNALDNEIVGNGLDNILIGGAGADTLTGGAGVDTFRLTSLTDSLAASMDTITDFVIGTDVLDAPTAVARNRITAVAVPGTFSVATLEFLLTPTALLANRGAMVTFGGSTTEAYLVLNDGIAGYNPATDAVIRIRYTGRIARFIVT